MSNVVRIKRRTSGAAGAPASLKSAELAYNMVDKVVYIGFGDDGSGNATSVLPVGGSGAFADLTGDQTLAGTKTFSSSPLVPTPATGDNSTKAASTAFVKAQNYLIANQTITFTGDATGSGSTNVALTLANSGVAAGTYPKVTVDAKGRVTAGAALAATDIPVIDHTKISDFDTQVRTSRLDQMAAPAADVAMNAHKLTGLADPVSNNDAVNKQYVDALKNDQDWKDSVRTASLTNWGLSGVGTVGGVFVAIGDRVALLGQTTASQNGIWIAATNAWTRAPDADANSEVSSGMCFFVEEGDNAGKQFRLTTPGAITVGTTALTFTQFGAQQSYTADAASMTLTGNQFSVNFHDGLVADSGGGKFDTSWAGVTAIVGVGTLTAGTWHATAIGLAYGGTGTDLSGAVDGAIFKKSGTGLVAATAGTDYLNNASTIDGGTF